MAQLDDLYAALKNADAAGDTAGAKKLAAYIQTMPAAGAATPAVADATPAPTPEPSTMQKIARIGGIVAKGMIPTINQQDAGDAVAGGVRGLKDVVDTGATLLASGYDKLTGSKEKARVNALNEAGKKDFASEFSGNQSADIGRVIGQGVAVYPVGGVLGAGAKLAGMTRLGTALGSAGLTTGAEVGSSTAAKIGDLALRSGAGAAVGAASAGLVDPNSAGLGAAVGGALPGALKVAGAVASPIGKVAERAIRSATQSSTAAGAEDIAKALSAATPEQRLELIAKLRSSETLIPGSTPTAAQALMTPEASIVQRVVHDSPGAAALREKLNVTQPASRLSALEGVAPTNAGGLAEAKTDLGTSIERQIVPEQLRLKKQVSAMYKNVDPTDATRINLPIGDLNATLDKYLGNGTFGQGTAAEAAVSEAQRMSKGKAASTPNPFSGMGVQQPKGVDQLPVNWQDLQSFRSSIGQAWKAAKADPARASEAAALDEMRSKVDSTVAAAASGKGAAGDVMPKEVAAAWQDANASYANLQQRFKTGPQAGIFRMGGDGQPVKQGGEIASAFWGNRPGLAKDVDSFKRLVDEQPGLMGQFRSMVTTHGASTADAAGNLTTKFSKWVDQTLPGLRGAFSESEVKTLQRIAEDIDRSAKAAKLGTSLGVSNTYQNAANALDLGLLGNPALDKAAHAIPGVRAVAGTGLDWMRTRALNAKSTRMANLLSDSGATANALEELMKADSRSSGGLADVLTPSIYRGLPRSASNRGSQ